MSDTIRPAFTPEQASVAGKNSVRRRPGFRARKLLDLQEQAYADALNPETPVAVRASLMRAFHDLERLRLDIVGHGKPRPVTARNDPEARAKAKPRAGLPEPIDAEKR